MVTVIGWQMVATGEGLPLRSSAQDPTTSDVGGEQDIGLGEGPIVSMPSQKLHQTHTSARWVGALGCSSAVNNAGLGLSYQGHQQQHHHPHHGSIGSHSSASIGTTTYKRARPVVGSSDSSMIRVSSSPAILEGEYDVPPQEFLHQILRERGYETEPIKANQQSFFQQPTPKQVQDYDLALVNAVKSGDLDCIRQMAMNGRRMDACNKHGESIVHISCRRGHADILRFLLQNGGRVHMCDDLGRTPLHDACWAKTPVFECVSALMEQDPTLIRVVDCRGASPLAYIRREHWTMWKNFFDSKKEEYWKHLDGTGAGAAASAAGGSNAGLFTRGLSFSSSVESEEDLSLSPEPLQQGEVVEEIVNMDTSGGRGDEEAAAAVGEQGGEEEGEPALRRSRRKQRRTNGAIPSSASSVNLSGVSSCSSTSSLSSLSSL